MWHIRERADGAGRRGEAASGCRTSGRPSEGMPPLRKPKPLTLEGPADGRPLSFAGRTETGPCAPYRRGSGAFLRRAPAGWSLSRRCGCRAIGQPLQLRCGESGPRGLLSAGWSLSRRCGCRAIGQPLQRRCDAPAPEHPVTMTQPLPTTPPSSAACARWPARGRPGGACPRPRSRRAQPRHGAACSRTRHCTHARRSQGARVI